MVPTKSSASSAVVKVTINRLVIIITVSYGSIYGVVICISCTALKEERPKFLDRELWP
jgi:hypothetical protein